MSITKQQAVQIVESLVNKSFARFKQELAGENEEGLDRLLRQYQAGVARRSWKVAQKWTKWDDEGPVLVPGNTRIYYRKGDTEVLVREFAPQIRLLKFVGSLSHRKNTSEKLDDVTTNKVFHYSLALPYVVFAFKFTGGKFVQLQCAFSDRPLQNLDEKPLKPYFSNIDNTLKVCLGNSFDEDGLVKGDIFQQSSYVMSYFWQAVNSEEWAMEFWKNKSHFQETDPRLATLEAWQEASADNSLFVIEDVKWLTHSDDSFGDMVVKLFEGDTKNAQFNEDLHKDLTDNFMKELLNSLKENMESAKDKSLKAIVDTLANELVERVR